MTPLPEIISLQRRANQMAREYVRALAEMEAGLIATLNFIRSMGEPRQ